MNFVDNCALLSRRLLSILNSTNKVLRIISVSRFHMDSKNESKSSMEIVNVPRIVSIYRQSLHTFDESNAGDLTANLNKLKTMMDGLRADDLGFDKSLEDPAMWRKPNKAPCKYIEVYQDSSVNMSIFVLKPGFKMPLHDHPHMHGLLKVISGAVNIRSFTEYPLKELSTAEFAIRAKQEASRLARSHHSRRKLFAEITHHRVCSANSETCTLTPTISNYHEIQALEMPAAFFDVLAPPYDTFIEDIGPRRCHYYKVANTISSNLVELYETDVPECFYCDQVHYAGPVLS